MNALMTLTMMFSLNVIKTTGDCPRYCECKWKSGKESVLCTNANMTEIPRHLDSGTQLLDLTGNRLQSIGPDEFFNASLLNLQKIFLSRCRLRFIEKSSFRKIINLVELDLSYNELHSVPSHTFEFITELRELRLNGNPIIRVLNNAFKMVPRLTKLDLSECRIGYVEIKAFQGLETSLEWLKLDKNKIVNIKPFALVNLGNLHGLELSGNPWNCSCGLRMLREWMLKQNVPYSIPPVCKYPTRLADRDWDKLDLDEFACVPRIEAQVQRKNGEEGTNVTIGCHVNGVPNPTVRWLRKNLPIANSTVASAAGGKPRVYIIELEREMSNLTILGADVQDNGLYVCRAENRAGRSEANITLTIYARPAVRIWSSRMIAAVGLVSLLFALAVGLLTFCAWSSRKRKFHFRHPVGSRDYDADGYEMNKKPINYNKIVDYGNHYSSNSTSHTYEIPGKTSGSGNFNERNAELSQEDNKEASDYSTMQTSGFSGISRRENVPNSLKMSNAEERLSKYGNSGGMSPDLHIPRLNEHETHKSSPCTCSENQFSENSSTTTYTMASSASYRSFNPSAEPRFSPANPNRTFYAETVHPHWNHKALIRGKCPDLLDLSKNTENLINNNNSNNNKGNSGGGGSVGGDGNSSGSGVGYNNNNNNNNNSINSSNNNNVVFVGGGGGGGNSSGFCTVPRKRSGKAKKNRRESVGSESQSPLLPGSSNDSCDSNYSSSSRRPSLELGSQPKNASFPSSPGNVNQTHFPSAPDESPKTLKYKSWKLEKFLKEYRLLQDQLYKMKESCENLSEEGLRGMDGPGTDEDDGCGGVLGGVHGRGRNRGKMTTPGDSAATSSSSLSTPPSSLYGINKKFLDNDNFGAPNGGIVDLFEEDNNNPKSISKNKRMNGPTGNAVSSATENPTGWPAGSQLMDP